MEASVFWFVLNRIFSFGREVPPPAIVQPFHSPLFFVWRDSGVRLCPMMPVRRELVLY